MPEKKKKALWVDEDVHHQVIIMAVTKKLSIGKCLKELVAERKANPLVRVERSVSGPKMYIGSVMVKLWVGTEHNEVADELARKIKAEL